MSAAWIVAKACAAEQHLSEAQKALQEVRQNLASLDEGAGPQRAAAGLTEEIHAVAGRVGDLVREVAALIPPSSP